MKTLIVILALSSVTAVSHAKVDAKKMISKFAELSTGLGYNDGSTLSLSLQEARGPYSIEMFKIYKEANDKMTQERANDQKNLDKLSNMFDRKISNRECKALLLKLRTSSRGLGYVKGMHSIASNNEESHSQKAAQASLAELNGNLKYEALASCKTSIESMDDSPELL